MQINLPLISLLMLLPGCGQILPDCHNNNVVGAVKEIAEREMGLQLGYNATALFSYEVQQIQSKQSQSTHQINACTAQLIVTATQSGNSGGMAISYTIEQFPDDESIEVNVYGL